MLEQRKHSRHRTLKSGQIVFNHRSSVITCTIRNLSEAGACLQVASSVGVPDSFDLTVEPDIASRHCHVAWRSEHRIGVTFQ
jgi:hypothetical protein